MEERFEVLRGSKYFILNKREKFYALKEIEFFWGKNTSVGVVGETGSGKSTLAKVLIGLYPLDGGKVLFCGKEISSFKGKDNLNFRKKVQMVFQNPLSSLNPHHKIKKILYEPLKIHKIENNYEKLIEKTLNSIRLGKEILDKYPSEISGGQRQRISIGRGLILNPEFLILDEPLSALDLSTQSEIINLLMDLKEELKISYLLISHDMRVVFFLCEEVYVFYRGMVMERAKSSVLKENPLHPYTKYLLSSILPRNPEEKKKFSFEEEKEILSKGCPFLGTCKESFERCFNEEPKLKEIEKNHWVSCFKCQI